MCIFGSLKCLLWLKLYRFNWQWYIHNNRVNTTFTESAPLGRFSRWVAMSVCVCVCLWFCGIWCHLFWGLSLALRSHDQFLSIQIYLNIWSELYFLLSNIGLSIFMREKNLDIIYTSKNFQCKILFWVSISEPFKIFCQSVMSTNIWIFKCDSSLYLCYFWRTNIFRYLFGIFLASKYIYIFVWYIIWHLNIFVYSFVSILWYLIITATSHV